MLISKFSLWICALALGGALAVHAQDNPAQAAARAALQQKMNELDANPSASVPSAYAPASAPTAPAVVPEVAPAAVAPVAPATAIEATPTDAAPVVETPAPAATAPAAAVETATPVATAPTDTTRAALLQKMHELDTKPAAAEPAAPAVAKTEIKAPVAKPTPSSAPALSKDERLMLLLARYKADQITPEQYHTERAAILAEP
jgi:hypothetical protein